VPVSPFDKILRELNSRFSSPASLRQAEELIESRLSAVTAVLLP